MSEQDDFDKGFQQAWSEALCITAEGLGRAIGVLACSDEYRREMLNAVKRAIEAGIEQERGKQP